MDLRYLATLAGAILFAGALVAIAVGGWKRRTKDFVRQRKRLRAWRKQHGVRAHSKATKEPPAPFHVRTKLGDPGDPRTGISTSDTDNLFRR